MAAERTEVFSGFPEVRVTEEPRDFDPPSVHCYRLKSGNKNLMLNVRLSMIPSTTSISTNGDEIKIAGATSAVYRVAANILDEAAQQHRKPIDYILKTGNDVMKRWARDKIRGGAAIFTWDSIREDHTGLLVAKKTFGKQFGLIRKLVGFIGRK